MRSPLRLTVSAFALMSLAPFVSPSHAQNVRGMTNPAGQSARAQALAARDRAFAILDDQVKGGVEEPPMAMLGVPDLDNWLFRRYRSITEDETLTKRQRERMIAGTVHQDLQLAEYGLTSNEPLVQKKALRVATIANLYVGMLPADPRLQAAVYEGFLLPNVEMAPEKGWGAQPALLEGAAVANRVIGQSERQISLLRSLINYQKKRDNVPGADIARIHLSDALEGRAQYFEAAQQLSDVTTPDLLGAKSYLDTLWRKALVQREEQRAAFLARGGTEAGATTPNPGANGNGEGNGNGQGAAGANGVAAPALPPGGLSNVARGGRRLAQNNGGRGAGNPENGEGEGGAGEGEALDGESEKMRRMRLAAEAAQVAQELTKKANELSTISLAKMLDAADAQLALEAAEKGGAPRRTNARRAAAAGAAPATDIFTLRRTAENGARKASEASGDAKRAAQAAQKASEEAAKLALRVFIVDHDAPKEGEAPPDGTPAQATPAQATPAQVVGDKTETAEETPTP